MGTTSFYLTYIKKCNGGEFTETDFFYKEYPIPLKSPLFTKFISKSRKSIDARPFSRHPNGKPNFSL